MSKIPRVDGFLGFALRRALRRGTREPIWLAVAGALWLVRRSRAGGSRVVWSGRLEPGEGLFVRSADPAALDTRRPRGR